MRPGTESLSALPLFRSFGAAQIEALNELADLARVGPDEELFRQGDQLHDLHILLTGLVTETRVHHDGDALTDVMTPVRPIGFAPALLGVPSPTGARTITSVRVITIPAAALQAMLREEPALAMPFLHHSLASLREQTLELCELKLRSSVQRLAAFLLSRITEADLNPARFVLPYEKRFLAGKIGCSQENLSRAFAALRRIGVETKSSIVVIRDVAALEAFAGVAPTP